MQEFQRKISKLSERIKKDKEFVKSEADSESVFIEPFLEILGYKMQDIGTIKRQYPADFGRVGNEDRVDYAILQDNKPLVVIEVKHHSEKLDKHIGQLKRYFAACIKSCHFGVLTDGIEYRFFSNFKDNKEMDEKPFFSLNLEQNFSERDLKMLKMFVKGEIRIDEIKQTAQHNFYFTQIKAKIKSEIESPSDEFVGLFKKISHKQLQPKFKEKFKEIVKQAFESVIDDFVLEKSGQKGGENLKNEDKNGVSLNANLNAISKQNPAQKSNSQRQYQITQDEQKGFEIIASMLGVENVFWENRKLYLNVFFKNDSKPKIICRFYFNSAKKLIKIGVGKNEVERNIKSLDELFNFKKELSKLIK